MNICSICGEPYDETHYLKGSIRSIMESRHVCFNDAFWIEMIQLTDENTFVIDHHRYTGSLIDKEKSTGFIGFGGKDMYVKYDNGKICHYNNVWYQGEVPERWWSKIPNNASWLTEQEYTKLTGDNN